MPEQIPCTRARGSRILQRVRSADDPEQSRHPASQHETKGTNVTTTVGPRPAERTAQLRVGFVGAGKIGFALGLHLFRSGARISGYASRSHTAAQWAAQCTNSVSFSSLQALLDSTDLIFITVPDGAIAQVAGELAAAANAQGAQGLAGKIVCHASGSATSDELAACRDAKAACASVHPLCAVPDVPHTAGNSNEDEDHAEGATAQNANATLASIPNRLTSTFFTLEGDAAAVAAASALLDAAGNSHCTIAATDKVRYHAAAVFMSNLVCGLASEGLGLLEGCGFTETQALEAVGPLFTGNCEAIAERGPQRALSGPIERNDVETVRRHLAALDGQARVVYAATSLSVCDLAERRHPERNMQPLRALLESAQNR